ncbi:AzlC family ABC transporter permease [Brevibacterium spongiae]|uniref:AzlC family ABC transporter permease n=1 Tax=Brevibacterium spongiae TaxID=2909672 RepID=A0ABY5SLU9_9MICO|nr:AzlC family ABC transporter permease [Brevibacterium spongiae]UVI35520.1 AzlC family ABC transporter permease [Brevibacterium spongiae]
MGSLFRTAERARSQTRQRGVERTLPGSIYRAVAIVTVTIIAVALSYGAISAVSGFAWWQTLLLAMFALGGAAEFTFVGVIAAGGAPILAVLAGLLVNSRNFAFGVAVGPFFPQDWRALIASHWINDESTAISRMGQNDRAKWHAFLLMGAAIALMWPSGAMAGQWLGNVIDADMLGLDAAFPIILFCLIRGDLKNRVTLSLTLAGIIVAVCLTPVLPLGLGAVTSLSVFVFVAAGWAVRSMRRRRGTHHEAQHETRDRLMTGTADVGHSAGRHDAERSEPGHHGSGLHGSDHSSAAGEDRR